jgi:hypothetical protein
VASDPTAPRSDAAPERVTLDRRSFVVSAAFALTAFAGARWLVATAEAAPADTEAFRTLSAFLTGAPDLDAELAARAFGQLTELDAGFADKAGALASAVATSDAPSIDDFLAHPASSDAAVRTTAVTIVSAWYLGYTGTPISLRAEDDTGFVTFTGALMYGPTMDATVRPTYARAGLNYWVEPPPFVTPPPMPEGIRSWGRESPQGIGTIPQAPATMPEDPPAPPSSEPPATEP